MDNNHREKISQSAPKEFRDQQFAATKPKFHRDETIALMRQHGVVNTSTIDLFTRFRRFPTIDPYNMMGTTQEVVFFTKPNLQILSGANIQPNFIKSNVFLEAHKRYFNVLNQLQWNQYPANPFNTLLFNTRSANIDIPDINTSTDFETGKTILGSSIFYRGHSLESDENHEFSIEFTDNRNIETYMWFRLFDEYERLKHIGRLSAMDDVFSYTKTLNDQFSIYRFILGPDGESIIHYSKFTGVYPKQVPRATFSDMPADGVFKFTVNFKANFVEDMEPAIIMDFMTLCRKMESQGGTPSTFVPLYDGYTGEWMIRPTIVVDQDPPSAENAAIGRFENNIRYKLKWIGPEREPFVDADGDMLKQRKQ